MLAAWVDGFQPYFYLCVHVRKNKIGKFSEQCKSRTRIVGSYAVHHREGWTFVWTYFSFLFSTRTFRGLFICTFMSIDLNCPLI